MTEDTLFPTEYKTKKGRTLKGKQLEVFEQFWRTFKYSKGKASAADAWYDLKVSPNMLKKILAAARKEADNREQLKQEGRTPIMAQGWLSGRRFEDETTESTPNQAVSTDTVEQINKENKEMVDNPGDFPEDKDWQDLFKTLAGVGG